MQCIKDKYLRLNYLVQIKHKVFFRIYKVDLFYVNIIIYN